MKSPSRTGSLIIFAFILCLFLSTSARAQVKVYAEGTYKGTDVVVYIYADTNEEELRGFCVKLTYNPAELTNPVAVKNSSVWSIGGQPYQDPVIDSVGGNIVIIGGKLDTASPTTGVTGTRILLATATFARLTTTTPGSDAAAFFGISLDAGKPAPFDNFVTTGTVVLDGSVIFSAQVWERGDANADGKFNVLDMMTMRDIMFYGSTMHPWSDCNGDGKVNVLDMMCVRDIMFGL